jgi:hypothetical protein
MHGIGDDNPLPECLKVTETRSNRCGLSWSEPPTSRPPRIGGATRRLTSPPLALLESRLRPGALLVADNADQCPEYLARVRDPAQGYVSVPFANDVELSMRI